MLESPLPIRACRPNIHLVPADLLVVTPGHLRPLSKRCQYIRGQRPRDPYHSNLPAGDWQPVQTDGFYLFRANGRALLPDANQGDIVRSDTPEVNPLLRQFEQQQSVVQPASMSALQVAWFIDLACA